MRVMHWLRGSNQVTRPRAVVLTDEDGRVLKPWEVRAGMLIVSTRYSHRDQAVVCVLNKGMARRLNGTGAEYAY